jgi:hypothetical protein
MAIQAVLDPSPLCLIAHLAPAPSDVVWQNTYLGQSSRMIRSWSITFFIVILSIVWFIPIVGLAGLLNLCTIQKVWPQLADALSRNEISKALVQTGLPTLVISLLNIGVFYLYDCEDFLAIEVCFFFVDFGHSTCQLARDDCSSRC